MKRLLFVSDAAYPVSNTGFGVVSAQLLRGLVETGQFDIVHLGRGAIGRDLSQYKLDYRMAGPPLGDPNAFGYVQYLCELEKPDLICFECDPGSLHEYRKNVEVRRIPNLVHTPVEGAPLLPPWADSVYEITLPVRVVNLEDKDKEKWVNGRVTTYTEFGKQTIEKSFTRHAGDGFSNKVPVEVLPLGTDHVAWERYDLYRRTEIRARLNWTGKFVVMNVARNAQRKEWVRLLKAIKIVKPLMDDVILYAHCVPFENYFLQGHNLIELAHELEITDRVQFLSDLRDPTSGIAFSDNPNGLTLMDFYNAADLFVAPTAGEGFNLPQCEAAACGLPVVTTKYAGGWEVAEKFAYPLFAAQYNTHPMGIEMAAVDPLEIARIIMLMRDSPKIRKRMSEDGMAVVAGYTWEHTVKRFAEIAVEMMA